MEQVIAYANRLSPEHASEHVEANRAEAEVEGETDRAEARTA